MAHSSTAKGRCLHNEVPAFAGVASRRRAFRHAGVAFCSRDKSEFSTPALLGPFSLGRFRTPFVSILKNFEFFSFNGKEVQE
jgi:hypothetical protein